MDNQIPEDQMSDVESELREAIRIYVAMVWPNECYGLKVQNHRREQLGNFIHPLLEKRHAEIAELKLYLSRGSAQTASMGGEIDRLERQLAAAKKDSERLKDALDFYSDRAAYDKDGAPLVAVWISGKIDHWEKDCGKTAREAFEDVEKADALQRSEDDHRPVQGLQEPDA